MNEVKTKKRGRPFGTKSENPRSTQLPVVRVTPDELTTYKAAAQKEGLSFSAWVRKWLDKGAKKNQGVQNKEGSE